MNGIALAILIPFAGTILGAAFVFLLSASGVMVAASVWSLLMPAMEMEAEKGNWSVMPATIGFLIGIVFLLLIDGLTPHLHMDCTQPEGLPCKLSRTSRTTMLSLAVTIHNLPEGMAVGVVIAAALQEGMGITAAAAMAMSVGIAIQNIPEGAIVSMPLRGEGHSRWKAFLIGALSGIVEPIGAILVGGF